MKPKVGISACLLGERVRYDGDHRRDPLIVDVLGERFAWIPVCPEAEAGFGVPRETLRLEGPPDAPRMVTTTTGIDRTGAMEAWIGRRLVELPGDLCGFVLKRGSPSCGPRRVKLFASNRPDAEPAPVAAGLFARALAGAYPGIPIADEEMLAEAGYAAEFVRRVESIDAELRVRRG